MSSRGRIHRAPLALAALLTVVVGVGGGAGVYFAGEREEEGIERVEELTEVLAANEGPAENFLIVGSDNRDVIDEDDEDAGLFLDGATGEGGRSDTIMILRRDHENGASLLSIPRDLWLPIAETGDDGKVNWAYIGGPRRLAATITQGLGVPIHHYVEVDFAGFQQLVDEIGGVEICVGEYAVKDDNSGLSLQPGCQVLDGRMALAYSRSRFYEEFRDGDWRMQDGAPDLNRIARQQHFLRTAAAAVMAEINSNPFRLGDLIDIAGNVVRLDATVDVLEAGEAMFAAAEDGLHTYVLPVEELTVGDQSALQLSDGADEILDYFRGAGPLPVVTETSAPPSTSS
jgi:LCP family protein required for cell wall assembly